MYDLLHDAMNQDTDNQIDERKYRNAILYLAHACPQGAVHGKKKLAKLLYFLDFDRYEYRESLQTITGDTYKKKPMGPVPDTFEEVVQRMIADEQLKVRSEYEYQGLQRPTTIYTPLVSPDESVFNEDDMFILKRVAMKYSALNGRQLEDISHSEQPWKSVQMEETIPVEFSFYRGTDFRETEHDAHRVC